MFQQPHPPTSSSCANFKMKQLRHSRLARASETMQSPDKNSIFAFKPKAYSEFPLSCGPKEPSVHLPQNTLTTQQTGLFSRRLSVPKIVLNNSRALYFLYIHWEINTQHRSMLSFCLIKFTTCASLPFWKESHPTKHKIKRQLCQVRHHFICGHVHAAICFLGPQESHVENWLLVAMLCIYISSNILGFQICYQHCHGHVLHHRIWLGR